MPSQLVIWGASGHARVVADMVRLQGNLEIIGFLDDLHPERAGTSFCGSTILGGREKLADLASMGVRNLVVAFGDCRARLAAAAFAAEADFNLCQVVHPRAVVAADVTIGPGTTVMAGGTINPGAVIGHNVIVNTNATIEHECVLEAGAHVCPNAVLGGQVRVGQAAWIGIGATVREKLSIGADAVIGAGAVVIHDIPARAVAYGVPATVRRYLESHAS